MFPEVLGYFGGTILSIQMLPQIYKIVTTKSVVDISLNFLLLNLLGLVCMTGYGIIRKDMPLYIPTSISTLNTVIVLILKLTYSKTDENNDRDVNNICKI